ncbi:DUF421 domain-containing protein [Bacillus sonorensis]|uniref:YetF C-terminal domain-containing protein n=2 Tax=Bacillus sonorensis TaxID=119858 RepID=M5P8G7_9BACI|nr:MULTISPECIES: DUF421 domain-containing protein [Bacillus]TWK82346.1 hypothetical protein CHCC20335_3389 [Bacillus paralicheniformis]ASB88910.1 UPF0702 transmembrane protein YdfS [Bacillus sonorensis]EME76286.1 hypothetical protein BSONL12_00837 [Bacillus sonorensis L12]MBG9915315.1 membrane protein [Bacillus sonorensis]MCF7618258.1 DUF421 domain-containing protein [Bacillus sonorensis]
MPDWLDVVVRSIIFVIVLFVMTKMLGKRQLAELSVFEYIAGITIGGITSEVVMGLERSIINAVIAIVIFSSVPFLVEWISLKNKTIRDFLEGTGTVFIKDGKIMEDNLKKEKYSSDELLELLRKKNVFRISDVQFAILEQSGDLNVLLKKEHRPVTIKDLQMPYQSEKEPQTVIMDGEILDEPLAEAGLNRRWLNEELEKLGVAQENVFLGQVDSDGQLTVDLYDDQIKVPAPQEKPLLLATIKKCQADLELFALATDSKSAKAMYAKNAKKLKDMIQKLEPALHD